MSNWRVKLILPGCLASVTSIRGPNLEAPSRKSRGMARGPSGAARGGEGVDAEERRAGPATARAAVGPGRQGVPIRDRCGERLAGGPLRGALAAPRLPLHV